MWVNTSCMQTEVQEVQIKHQQLSSQENHRLHSGTGSRAPKKEKQLFGQMKSRLTVNRAMGEEKLRDGEKRFMTWSIL